MNGIFTGLLLILLAATAAADTRSVQLHWEELPGVIGGKKVFIRSTTGAVSTGHVRTVDSGEIVFEGRNPPVKRKEVAEIRMTEYAGNSRHIGRRIGGAIGLIAGLVSAAAIGLSEGSGSSAGAKTAAVALAVGGLPAGLLLGDYLGKQADKQITIIHIAP